MLELLGNPAVVALIAGVPSIALAIIGYRQSIRQDKRASDAGDDAFHITATTQVIDAYKVVIDNLHADIQQLRTREAQLLEQISALLKERRENK